MDTAVPHKYTVLAGCNTVLRVFHKHCNAVNNHFILESHGAQRKKMPHDADLDDLIWLKTPGSFVYFTLGPRTHPCVLGTLG